MSRTCSRAARALCAALAAPLILCGCKAGGALRPAPPPSSSVAAPSSAPSAAPLPAVSSAPPAPACWFDQIIGETVAKLGLSGAQSDAERIRAAYRAVIAKTTYLSFEEGDVLYGHWRWLDGCGEAPDIMEVMAAGPLYYGMGECENYSAALIVLLRRMGYKAMYVAGLTYSVHGTLVDHAWAMVMIDGTWYHIDPQLEDNVIREGADIEYRYFLKGDAEFSAHHVWGAALRHPDAHSLALPACPKSLPSPPPEALPQDGDPDAAALGEAALQAEAAAPPLCAQEPAGTLPPLPRYVDADPSLWAQ